MSDYFSVTPILFKRAQKFIKWLNKPTLLPMFTALLSITGSPVFALTINPELKWNTFIKGEGGFYEGSMAIDLSGNVYAINYKGVVTKLDATGNLVWQTSLDPNVPIRGLDIAADECGNVYVTGTSSASWGNPVRTYTSGKDAIAAKLDASGKLIWNTFLGENGDDSGNSIAVDGSGNVFVAVNHDVGEPSATKLDASGNLIWSTIVGGINGYDAATDIAVDQKGNTYLAGFSSATWGHPVRAFRSESDYDGNDGFAAKFNASGTLLWNTFLGGVVDDTAEAIAVDAKGKVYVSGYSCATWGKPIRAYSPCSAYAAKLNTSGKLTWNTFLGGSQSDTVYGQSIAVDGKGNVYVAGVSNETWGNPARAYTLGYDAFSVQLSASGKLRWNTFLGGSGNDWGNAIAVNNNGTIFVAGSSSANWGTPIQTAPIGSAVFVAALNGDSRSMTFKSDALHDGWVKETSQTSNVGGTVDSTDHELRLGDDAGNEQYRTLLDFNTDDLPDDALITGARLQLKKSATTSGVNPFNWGKRLLVDIKNGYFGATVALEAEDFQAKPKKTNVGKTNFAPIADCQPDWHQVELKTGSLSAISKTGDTQFRLRFTSGDNNNQMVDFVSFYAGQSADNEPVLIVDYALKGK